MVRAIDGDELYRIEKLLDTDIVRQDKVALNLLEQVLYDIQHVPTLTPQNEWVSVEDRLPEYNPGTGAKSYWVAKKDNAGNWQMKIAQYCDYGYAMTVDAETEVTWRDWDFTKIVNVTHWMSLPSPPGKDNNVPAKAPNEPLTCRGCMYAPDCPSEIHCHGCARMYTDHYRRPPEGEEDT